jgi:hypothetical protein
MLSSSKFFNTQVLRIALSMDEDRLASVVAAYYDVKLDRDMLDIAVRQSMFGFL